MRKVAPPEASVNRGSRATNAEITWLPVDAYAWNGKHAYVRAVVAAWQGLIVQHSEAKVRTLFRADLFRWEAGEHFEARVEKGTLLSSSLLPCFQWR